MGLFLKIKNFFTGEEEPVTDFLVLTGELSAEVKVRELAFATAVSRIARSLSKCEIRTFEEGEEVKKDDYYRFNFEPNRNQNSSAWMQELIWRLYSKNEALVIEYDDQLLIAETFTTDVKAKVDWTFKGVVVNDFQFDRPFKMREVLYFRLNNNDVKKLVNGIYEAYAKMMSAAVEHASRTGSVRGILNMQGQMAGSEGEKKLATEMLNERFKPMFESKNAVVPLPQGFTFQDLTKATERTIGGGGGITRDYRAMIDDIYDMTAMAFGIPPVLLKGQTAGVKEVFDMYLTDCIDPLADLIETEINRRMYGKEQVLKGTRVRVDTSNIKHHELFEMAGSIEKLVGSGTMTINDVRDRLGLKRSDDPIADKHLITKNFGTAAEIDAAGTEQKGGTNEASTNGDDD
jgi:HK97 family phage portal protein